MSFFRCQFFLLLIVTASGCALLKVDRGATALDRSAALLERENDGNAQHSDAPVRRVVRLQSSIVSALSEDRRLRTLVWEELDESGLMSPEDRNRLNQSGIRVGVCGGTTPWALASLLRGEKATEARNASQDTNGIGGATSLGNHVALPEGSSSQFELPLRENSLFIPPGEIAGLKKGADLQNARLVIEMNAVEYGDGWVLVRFLPQIHYGHLTNRYNIADGQDRMHKRQKIQPLYEQQFEVKLHNMETVVIGCNDLPEWTIGRMLFQSESLSARNEYLIALQLTAIEEVAGEKSMTVNYSRY